MKKYVLVTISESSDYYLYFIESEELPSIESIMLFLNENAHDKDDEYVYENILLLKEVDQFKPIK